MHGKPSIDEKRLSAVVDEIKAAGGDALGVAGDVGADDFPKRIVDATVQLVFCLRVRCSSHTVHGITENMAKLITSSTMVGLFFSTYE